MMVRRRLYSGGASAWKGDDMGMAERRRGKADGVGVFCWGGKSFYRTGGGAPGQ
jgi:hypothetical protein